MSEFVITSAGDRVAYDRRGEGPAVVFVAGAGPFRAIDPETSEVAELLAARGWTTVVHDRVGRGESAREGRVDLAEELAAVRALIEAAGAPAVLVGHSSGGAIALRAAVEGLPVAGLVLFEAPLDPAEQGVAEWTGELYRLLEQGDHAGAVTHYMKDIPLDILQGLQHSPLWEPFVAQAESLRPDAQALEWAMSAPHAKLFGGIEVPVRFLVGKETLPEMTAAAASIVAAIPGATQGEVAGTQHTWEPEAMADELHTFMSELSRSAVGS